MVTVHRRLICTNFDNFGNPWTLTFFFIYILGATALTFLLAFYTGDFWKQLNSYEDQPITSFTQDMILKVTTQPLSMVSTGNFAEKMFTTNENVNKLIDQNYFFFPEFKITKESDIWWRKNWEIAYNLATPLPNAAVDKFSFNFKIPLEVNENLYGFEVFLFFKQHISRRFDLEFNNVLHFSEMNPVPSSSLIISGDQIISQRKPFFLFMDKDTFNQPIFDLANVTSLSDLDFSSILQRYKEKETFSKFSTNYKRWKAGKTNFFECTLDVYFPSQVFFYTPWIWEVLKYAWIQILASAILIVPILWCIKDVIINNGMMDSREIKPTILTKKKDKVKFL